LSIERGKFEGKKAAKLWRDPNLFSAFTLAQAMRCVIPFRTETVKAFFGIENQLIGADGRLNTQKMFGNSKLNLGEMMENI
jgi:hypothetical protein